MKTESVYIVSGILKFVGLILSLVFPFLVVFLTGNWWFAILLIPAVVLFLGGAEAIATEMERKYEYQKEQERKYALPYYRGNN